MITLEAFITKSNIKKQSKLNSIKHIKYDDIEFREPEMKDMKLLQSRLNKQFQLFGKIDGLNVIQYNIGTSWYDSKNYIGMYIQHRVNNSKDIGGSHIKMECLLLFKIDSDTAKDGDNKIIFCEPGMEKKVNRDKNKYKDLYAFCEDIATAMGFTQWSDDVNGWIKPTTI